MSKEEEEVRNIADQKKKKKRRRIQRNEKKKGNILNIYLSGKNEKYRLLRLKRKNCPRILSGNYLERSKYLDCN